MTGGAGPIRVGVVGGGFGQHVQVPAFRSAPGVSVDAIAASTDARARTFAERLGIPRAYGDWRELVRDPAIDAVAVSVPPVLQAEIVLAAIAAGKHVFAEKPLGANVAEARAMVEAARAARVIGGIDFEFREIDAWRRARALLAEGVLGRLRHGYLSWRIETFAHRENKLSWKRDAAQGGGALNLFGSHALDSIVWLFGETRCVSAQLFSATLGTADARVEAWLEAGPGGDGGACPVSLSVATDALFGSGHRLEVYGDGGALLLENRGRDYAFGFTLALGRRGAALSPVALAPVALAPFPAGSDSRIVATAGVVHRFIDAIRTGIPMSPGFQDGLRVQELIDAIRDADQRASRTPWRSPS